MISHRRASTSSADVDLVVLHGRFRNCVDTGYHISYVVGQAYDVVAVTSSIPFLSHERVNNLTPAFIFSKTTRHLVVKSTTKTMKENATIHTPHKKIQALLPPSSFRSIWYLQ
jgi:hypothetical protein